MRVPATQQVQKAFDESPSRELESPHPEDLCPGRGKNLLMQSHDHGCVFDEEGAVSHQNCPCFQRHVP